MNRNQEKNFFNFNFMKKKEDKNNIESYSIVFNYFNDNELEIKEIKAISQESAEIEEVRKLTSDVFQPNYSFDVVSNFNSFQGYKITPIYTEK